MRIIKGKGAFPEITVGRFCLLDKNRDENRGTSGYSPKGDPKKEEERLREAVYVAADRFSSLARAARVRAGDAEAEIFETHRLMVLDDDLLASASELCLGGTDAVSAVRESGDRLKAMFLSSHSDYMRQRAADVDAVCTEVTDILQGRDGERVSLALPSVIGAFDLTPAQTLTLDKDMVLGFVTGAGGSNSHTAILARSMGIPAVVGAGEIPEEADGATVILDGCEGLLIISPDDRTLAIYMERMEEARLKRAAAEKTHFPPLYYGGRRIKVCANIAEPVEASRAMSLGADGIGLFRSEFLYMNRSAPPSEEEQYGAYLEAATGCDGEVVIRTLDAGADKEISYLGVGREPNPALGLRAVRLCLEREEIFRTQLRALLRASHERKISILIPMITVPDEFRRVRSVIDSVKASLERDKIPFDGDTPVGVMIETPSAAILAKELSFMADFFCVGTNDLIQYVMAADRQNSDVAYLCDGVPLAVMMLLSHVGACAVDAGIRAGICGESGADTELTEFFLRSGYTELSVSLPMINPLKEKLHRLCSEAAEDDCKK